MSTSGPPSPSPSAGAGFPLEEPSPSPSALAEAAAEASTGDLPATSSVATEELSDDEVESDFEEPTPDQELKVYSPIIEPHASQTLRLAEIGIPTPTMNTTISLVYHVGAMSAATTNSMNWNNLAEEAYNGRCNRVQSNLLWIKTVFDKNGNKRIVTPLLNRCPGFEIILSHMLVLRLGWRVETVDWTIDMKDWSGEVSERLNG